MLLHIWGINFSPQQRGWWLAVRLLRPDHQKKRTKTQHKWWHKYLSAAWMIKWQSVEMSWSSGFHTEPKACLTRAECGVQVVMEQHYTGSAGQISQVVKSLQGVWNAAPVLPYSQSGGKTEGKKRLHSGSLPASHTDMIAVVADKQSIWTEVSNFVTITQ